VARSDRRPLVPDLDLTEALRTCAARGHARVPEAIDRAFLAGLRRELDAGPFRRFEGSFGRVRQEIDGYDVVLPSAGFPLLGALARELGARVRSDGGAVRGLRTWRPNEIGVARYVPGSVGITPHLDGKSYRRLVVVATVHGRARFAICGSRDPADVLDAWNATPRDLVLMRGPGLAGARDGRPFHLVEGPRRGPRMSLGIRMAAERPTD
jgi:hypothetical protein